MVKLSKKSEFREGRKMGKHPCCTEENVKKGAWSKEEDQKLVDYVKLHGEGKWRKVAQNAGLNRCGKSCRLRWLNYLRPDIKIGNFTRDEDELIMELHCLHGNRWALIAGRLPGRTDNEIKNYWNTVLSKRLKGQTPKSVLRQRKYAKKRLIIDSPTPTVKPLYKDTKAVSYSEDDSQITINTSELLNRDSESLESSTTYFKNDSMNHNSQEFFSADSFSSSMMQLENSRMQEVGDEDNKNDIFSICHNTDIFAVLSNNRQMKQFPCFMEIENEWRDLWGD